MQFLQRQRRLLRQCRLACLRSTTRYHRSSGPLYYGGQEDVEPGRVQAIVVKGLFEGVAQWNAWFDSVYFTNSQILMTLPALLVRVVKGGEVEDMLRDPEAYQMQNPEGLKLATMVVAVLPITLIYPFLQRYFIKGLTLGSIKG